MTDFFYELFFSTQVVNPFFVKQAGLFLILMGFFYLVPLTNLEKLSRVTLVTIITKVCAVTFLFVNANVSSAPFMIYFAGFGDACMAIALSVTYVMFVIVSALSHDRAPMIGRKRAVFGSNEPFLSTLYSILK
jgi:hypothetical protein